MKSGVYQIVHIKSGRRYIGSASDVGKRIGSHKAMLRRNKHVNIALQRAYHKYGEDAFFFEKIFECTVTELLVHEQKFIDALGSHTTSGGYNIRIKAESSLGVRMKSRAYKAGDKYGRLTFLEQIAGSGGEGKHHQWKLLCDCGNEIIAGGGNVKSGITRSCGCYKKERIAQTQRIDRTGEKYNRLTFVYPAKVSERRTVLWDCLCDCGKHIVVPSNVVVNGNTKSCGCWNLENLKNRMTKMSEDRRYNFELFGNKSSTTQAAKVLGVSRNSFLYRMKVLNETPQQSCDHFIRKSAIKSIANCKSMVNQTISSIAA